RPVRWIVPYPPGGAADPIARLIGPFLSERLGKPVVIENKPGAGANIGTEFVVKSPPDGHTLLFITTANMINATFYRDLSFDFMRDITPVAGLVRLPLVLEVNPSVPVKTVAELIAYAKANPGKVNFASAGVGTSLHLAAELFNMMTGTKMIHVPYRGSAPALTDLLAGQVQVLFDNLFTSLEHIKAGKLRALGVATAARVQQLPDLPTVADAVPGYEASSVFGVGVPTGTPREITELLNRELDAALADPRIRGRLLELTAIPIPSLAAEFRAEMVATTEKWGRVIRVANIKAE
ncbi:MAG TPA: tripartite tricarboxylate transporter substrate binding protein, partial [Bradyrhizobium sp.]|nr:tripartite tricarboxylate transporter substrate binding protein [Bradyrhizobium sp.]